MTHVRVILVFICGVVGITGTAYSPADAQSYFNAYKGGSNNAKDDNANDGQPENKPSIFVKPKSSQGAKAYTGDAPLQKARARDQKSLFRKNDAVDNKSKQFARVNPYTFSKQQKLKVSEMKKESSAGMAFLSDWKAQGRTKPETPDEIKQYAAAQRSVSEGMMYSRREQLMAHLEKQSVRVAVPSNRGETSTRVSGAFGRGGFGNSGGQPNNVPSEKAAGAAKPSIFIRKKKADEEDGVMPKRIFNSVR